MAIQNETPHGRCKQCGFGLMEREKEGGGKEKICPRHGTLVEKPSGLINKIPDPGLAGFVKIKNSAGFEELVPISGPTEAQAAVFEKTLVDHAISVGEKATSHPTNLELTVPLSLLWESQDHSEPLAVALNRPQAEALMIFLEGAKPPEDMKEARKLYKLMDQLENFLKEG